MKPHTQTPWLCNDGKHIISESGVHIATVNMEGLSRDEVEANMALLCASPELLRVLNSIRSKLVDKHCGGTEWSDYQMIKEINQIIKIAERWGT